MIARMWTAKTSRGNAPAYAAHLKSHVLPALQAVDGYAGAKLLEREMEAEVEILVITFWHSLESIKGFAGEDFEKAVVSDEIAPLLTQHDQHVTHYNVTVEDKA